MRALCFDIGGSYIKYGIVENYEVKEFYIEKTNKDNLEEQLNAIIKKFQFSAIAIGFAGIVKDNKIVFAPNVKTYQEKTLNLKTDKKIVIDNDANLFTLGEWTIIRNYKNVIGITLGTGVGGGIIIDGKLYRGRGGAGEIGHIIIDENGPLCNCGNMGCIEAYIGEAYFPNYFEKFFKRKLKALEIYELAKNNDNLAIEFWKWFSNKLSILINNLVMIFEPDVIILGGGVSKAFDIFSKFLNLRSNVIIKKSELGEYASLIGGYELLVQNDN